MTAGKARGELRIHFGAAPGVGKTYAMLGEAHRRQDRGTDVVVAVVETHGRARIAEQLEGMEVLPRRTAHHRDVELTEMDLDAVLARRPEVVLVDELAHTNAPGSRNTKRWQDVDELLDAGITVLSTVNVQHLESLNDAVERITGIRQHETIPDEVVRRAEQIELVDLTPEALRRRMAHGNIYPADKIDAALGNYFRTGNLTALRELALLWVADQVDVALQRYREQKHISDTWEARERVAAAITGGPESETLVRRARRIANRAGADLLVVHVLRGDGLAGTPPGSLARLRELTDGIGATFHTVVGDDVPEALLDFARSVDATQLVLGTSRRSRWARTFDEGIGATTVQKSGPIDVHMVTHPEAQRGPRFPRLTRSPLSNARQVWGWGLCAVAPAAVTGATVVMDGRLSLANAVVCYFLATVLVAVVGGIAPAVTTALLGGGLLNFFLTEPRYTLFVADPQNIITVLVMILVGLVVAVVVDHGARLAQKAARARTEAALLASYSRTVLTHPEPLQRLLEKVVENFGQSSAALVERQNGHWHITASTGASPCARPGEADVDVEINQDVHLLLRARPGEANTVNTTDRTALEGAAGQALLALRQQRTSQQAADTRREADAARLRTALLSAVGHDLRTPLASMKASVSTLLSPDVALAETDARELLEDLDDALNRLTKLVTNLLDASRLSTGAINPRLEPVTYDELVASNITYLDKSRIVTAHTDDGVSPVLADPGLLDRVVANVLHNALTHGHQPGHQPDVLVHASEHAGQVELRIIDHGPGLPKHTAEHLFTPFQRLDDRSHNGIGLGLHVANGFIEAMGGEIRAEDTPGGGLTIILSLPAANTPTDHVTST